MTALLIANGKGLIPGPIATARTPTSRRHPRCAIHRRAVPRHLEHHPPPDRERWVRQMRDYTAQAPLQPVVRNPIGGNWTADNSPILGASGVEPPPRALHRQENRTYDQVLGDLLQGRGDSSLCLFPEAITRTTTPWPASLCCWTISRRERGQRRRP